MRTPGWHPGERRRVETGLRHRWQYPVDRFLQGLLRREVAYRPWNQLPVRSHEATVPARIGQSRVRLSVITTIALFSYSVVLVRFIRSEEHTSELQSRENLVCRLLLEKKKMNWPN